MGARARFEIVVEEKGSPAMLTKIAHRLLTLLPIVLGVTFLTFMVGHLAPGDPMAVYMGFRKDPLEHARLAHAFGLDLPIWQQYLRYLWHLLHGDLGTSYFQQDQSVSSILGRGIPVSLELGLAALGLSLLIGIPCGILAAVHHRTWIDTGTVAGMFVLYAIPSFVLIPLILWVDLALYHHGLPWLPVEGWGTPAHLVMPVLVIAAASSGFVARLTRASMLEVLHSDFIRTARSKGLTRRRVIYRHALRNALIPIVTFVGPSVAYLVTGSFVAEVFFNIPGIGFEVVQSVQNQDFPVIQGAVVVLAFVIVTVNLLTDVAYDLIDPRIRAGA